MTSKRGKNKRVAHKLLGKCVTDVLTTFYVFCYPLLNRRTATWNLFVLYNKKVRKLTVTFRPPIDHSDLLKRAYNLAYCICMHVCMKYSIEYDIYNISYTFRKK